MSNNSGSQPQNSKHPKKTTDPPTKPKASGPTPNRRKPTQARALAKVEAIIEAASTLLVEEGASKLTTNRIAQKAGVSIGTLYQYFSNKEELILALVEQHNNAMMQLLYERISKFANVGLEQAARELIKAWLDAHAVNPELQRVVMMQLSIDYVLERTSHLKHQAEAMIKVFLEQHSDQLAVDNLELAAFMVVTCVDSITHSVVLDRQELLSDDALLDHVTHIILSYLMENNGEHAP